MPGSDHNALLKRIARERLLPQGLVQQGRSRTFLKDHGWYTVMVEFQPSSFDKGSYLNVGADLHFFPRDHMAFCYGHRERSFTPAADADFSEVIADHCTHALQRVKQIEQAFSTYSSALRALGRSDKGDWTRYEMGFLHALAGNTWRARWYLGRVASTRAELDVERERVRLAREVIRHLGKADLPAYLQQVIRTARSMKGAPLSG